MDAILQAFKEFLSNALSIWDSLIEPSSILILRGSGSVLKMDNKVNIHSSVKWKVRLLFSDRGRIEASDFWCWWWLWSWRWMVAVAVVLVNNGLNRAVEMAVAIALAVVVVGGDELLAWKLRDCWREWECRAEGKKLGNG
ncbi:hypothetical protein Pfo_018955 [Paulownia fortunei]|nr:hypothetical protein Pfo_018955 [Paulownia fortunei]